MATLFYAQALRSQPSLLGRGPEGQVHSSSWELAKWTSEFSGSCDQRAGQCPVPTLSYSEAISGVAWVD